jgi:hypothetical protein
MKLGRYELDRPEYEVRMVRVVLSVARICKVSVRASHPRDLRESQYHPSPVSDFLAIRVAPTGRCVVLLEDSLPPDMPPPWNLEDQFWLYLLHEVGHAVCGVSAEEATTVWTRKVLVRLFGPRKRPVREASAWDYASGGGPLQKKTPHPAIPWTRLDRYARRVGLHDWRP